METLIAKNLNWLIKVRETNPTALAGATKVKQPTIHRILSGESQDPKTATLTPIANYFGVSVSDLRDKDLTSLPRSNVSPAPNLRGYVPLISWVRAGDFAEAVDACNNSECELVPITVNKGRHTFALSVVGDSMHPDFPEGMRLVVEPDMDAQHGDYVIAKNGEEATFKQLVRDGGDWYLKPINKQYPTKPLGTAHVIGVVREAVRKFR